MCGSASTRSWSRVRNRGARGLLGCLPTRPANQHGRRRAVEAVIWTHDPAGIPLLVEHAIGNGNRVTNASADFGQVALPAVFSFSVPSRKFAC